MEFSLIENSNNVLYQIMNQLVIYLILPIISSIITNITKKNYLRSQTRVEIINTVFSAIKIGDLTLKDMRNRVLSAEFITLSIYSFPYFICLEVLSLNISSLWYFLIFTIFINNTVTELYYLLFTNFLISIIILIIFYYLFFIYFLNFSLRFFKFPLNTSDALKDLVLTDAPRSSIFYTFYFFTFLLPVTNLANKIGVSLLFVAVIIAIGIGISIHTFYTALSDLGIIRRGKAQATKPDLETLIFSKARRSVWLKVYSDNGTTLGGWIISMGRELVLQNGKSEVHIPWDQINLFEIIVT